MTTDEIMTLADAYAVVAHTWRNPDGEMASEARKALQSAIESLVRDGERYRWLLEYCHEFKPAHYDGLPYGRHHIDLVRVDESDLDKAIDAAMEAQKGKF